MTDNGRPDNAPDTRRTPDGAVRTPGYEPSPTRPDTIRTPPADTPLGVRIEYRAAVPRRLVAAAFAEALELIARETRLPLEADTADDG